MWVLFFFMGRRHTNDSLALLSNENIWAYFVDYIHTFLILKIRGLKTFHLKIVYLLIYKLGVLFVPVENKI